MFDNSVLNVNNINFTINNKKILENISFKIYEKDVLCIIGPNGSGKSTLIKILTQEIEPSSGIVYFNNKSLNQWNQNNIAKKRAVLSQSNNLNFPFKVIDIIKMGRYPFKDKSNKSLDTDISKELINIFELNKILKQNYTTLSGGEMQRVHLARVFAQIWSENNYTKKLIILDEPTSFLDIKHQQALFKFIKKLNINGLTIIMVLHELNHSILNSNKILMLKDAKQICFGDTKEIMSAQNISKCFDIKVDILNVNNNNHIIYKN